MTILNVNSTRMEMQNLKHRLNIAQRGHKLLKEKQDSLVGQFSQLIEDARTKRKLSEINLDHIKKQYYLAEIHSDENTLLDSLQNAEKKTRIKVSRNNTKGVVSPKYEIETQEVVSEDADQPYSYILTPVFLDYISTIHKSFLKDLIELASIEKKCQILASELKTTRRRVNSLEYRTIPDLEETILSIKNRIGDQERSQLARMTKIK